MKYKQLEKWCKKNGYRYRDKVGIVAVSKKRNNTYNMIAIISTRKQFRVSAISADKLDIEMTKKALELSSTELAER